MTLRTYSSGLVSSSARAASGTNVADVSIGKYFVVHAVGSVIWGCRLWVPDMKETTWRIALYAPNSDTPIFTQDKPIALSTSGFYTVEFSDANKQTLAAAQIALQSTDSPSTPWVGQYCLAIWDTDTVGDQRPVYSASEGVWPADLAHYGWCYTQNSPPTYEGTYGTKPKTDNGNKAPLDVIVYGGAEVLHDADTLVFGTATIIGDGFVKMPIAASIQAASAVTADPNVTFRGGGVNLLQGVANAQVTGNIVHSGASIKIGEAWLLGAPQLIASAEANIQGVAVVVGKYLSSPQFGEASIQGTATVTPLGGLQFIISASIQGISDVLATPDEYTSPTQAVVIDFLSRKELVVSGNSTDYSEMIIDWHPAGFAVDRYKFRLGGAGHDRGFYIPTINGSENTEDGSTNIPSGTVTRTIINIADILPLDSEEDGVTRYIRLYTRNASTSAWSTLTDIAVEIPFIIYRKPPQAEVKDFILGVDTDIQISAGREFSLKLENYQMPIGATQAAVVLQGDDIKVFSTLDLIHEDHVDGFLEVETTVLLPITSSEEPTPE